MKRRTLLKMIPLGVASALVPGVLKLEITEPKFVSGQIRNVVFDSHVYNVSCAEQAVELFGKGSQIARIAGETYSQLRERVIYKLREPVTYD